MAYLTTQLGELATAFTGLVPARVRSAGPMSSRPLVQTTVIGGELPPLAQLEAIDLPALLDVRRYELAIDDVVLTARGVAIKASVVTAEQAGALLGPNLIALRPGPRVLSAVLAAWLQHPQTESRLLAARTGAGTPGFTVAQVRALALTLPPLQRQEQLAELWEVAVRHHRLAVEAAVCRRAFAHDLVFEALDEQAVG